MTNGVPGGSGNYIQNATAQQASANFNISGNGTAGGTLSANIVNAATQYNIGGSSILSKGGGSNLFLGGGAGASNTMGGFNAFFGDAAGFSNTKGDENAFFGMLAGVWWRLRRSRRIAGRPSGPRRCRWAIAPR